MTSPDTLGAALARQKWILLSCLLLSVIAAYVSAQFITPLYEASARIMVNSSRFTTQALVTEAELIKSTRSVLDVITALKLGQDPEFSASTAVGERKFLPLAIGETATHDPAVVQAVMERLRVDPVIGSYVLTISFRSLDAEKAALIVNTFAQNYVTAQALGSDQAGKPDIEARITALQEKLAQAETELLQGHAEQTQSADPAQRQLALAAFEKELGEISKRYGPKHPKRLALEQKLNDLKNSPQGAGMIAAQPISQERLAMLTSQVAYSRKALDDLAAVLKSRIQQEQAQGSEPAKIVSLAPVPVEPLHLIPSWAYGIVPLFGLLLGLLLAGINETLDRGFRSLQQIETQTGLTPAGLIPIAKTAAANFVLQKPASLSAEAVRTLRANLKLLGEKQGRQLKVIALTGVEETREKTLLTIWLARLAARGGEKVLLIDADLRQPLIHELVGHSNSPSLVDYLAGQTYLEQIIWKKETSGAHIIFGSPIPNTALDLIGSEKMKKLMSYLREGYDLVVINTPACLKSADAALLANEADFTLLAIEARTTDRTAVYKSLKLFDGFGYRALAPLLIEPKAKAV